MRNNDIEMRHPNREFVPTRRIGICANWFRQGYERKQELPKVEKPVMINVEKFIGRIVL